MTYGKLSLTKMRVKPVPPPRPLIDAIICIMEVAARNAPGKCGNNLPSTAFQQIIKAQGPVKL